MSFRLLAAASTLVALVLSLSGCAVGAPMALQGEAVRVTETSKPIYLMTATLKNDFKPSIQPKLMTVELAQPGAVAGTQPLQFAMDEKGKDEAHPAGAGNHFLIRLELPPGAYELRGLRSMGQAFPILGYYYTPLLLPLAAKGPGVYYLGHISATVRERQGDEFRAGQVLPLIDQLVSGASGGTFDVEVKDAFDADQTRFRAKFPALAGVTIQKAVLPPFDRSKAQKWWSEN